MRKLGQNIRHWFHLGWLAIKKAPYTFGDPQTFLGHLRLQTSRTQQCVHFSSSAGNCFKGKSTTESRVWWHTWTVPALGGEAGESWILGHLQLHTKFKDSLVSTKEICVEASEQQAASLCLGSELLNPWGKLGSWGEPVFRSCKREWYGICESHGQASWKSSVKFQRFAPYQHS